MSLGGGEVTEREAPEQLSSGAGRWHCGDAANWDWRDARVSGVGVARARARVEVVRARRRGVGRCILGD